ncbi:von Willebrand factor type A domain protein [Gimesia alba]|uniref:von Willebrand factor type A domain protein n=1 Tax=Gimesia alba TaxID=2527973 RepID=A0A517RJD6_9PLAN|nr:VIT and VWA domain-containing protein [Gimesia alba]QDT43997.1 von Willebrand factor type A domain protein [Gimesia alba]
MRFYLRGFGIIAAAILLSTVSTVTHACFMRAPQPVQVWLDHINVDIQDQVAVKTYRCGFRNPNGRAIVGGTCYMELEPGTQVNNMSVLVDGKEMQAEILDVEKANQVFQEIVKKGGSPALLEYYGNQLIQTKIPRVEAGKTVMVKLTYTTVLKKRGDLIRLQMLNTNPKALMQPLKEASVTVNIRSTEPIKNIYSPTHQVKLVEKRDWDISVEWKQKNYLPKHPFVLYYQTTPDEVGASLIAHREPGEPGYFMMMLSPTQGQGVGKLTEEKILPKDVVFCVDTSGSMLQQNKMEQARDALKYCINHLRPGDRFNIIDFSTTARHFHQHGLIEFNEESKQKALAYADAMTARGATAIEEALLLSLKHLEKEVSLRNQRLKMIVFSTDGLPTVGERDASKLLKTISEKNSQHVRLFVFGEGYDVNTKLLDFLALDHRGEADYILPDEDLTKKISQFFDRVGSPIMADVSIDFAGAIVTDVYPRHVKDLFKGEQLLIYGRYTGSGSKTVRVTGTVNGARVTQSYQLEFPRKSADDKNSFVPRLWAGQKVDYLIAQIRNSGQAKPDQELVDEITLLAKQHGIVTPYTSFLMADDTITEQSPMPLLGAYRRKLGQKFEKELEYQPFKRSTNGSVQQEKVLDAQSTNRDRYAAGKSGNAARYYDQAEREMKKFNKRGSALKTIRYIGNRTFYKSKGLFWNESLYDPHLHQNLKIIEVGSTEYFELLKQDQRLAKYFSLGNVILQIDQRWYQVTEKSRS